MVTVILMLGITALVMGAAIALLVVALAVHLVRFLAQVVARLAIAGSAAVAGGVVTTVLAAQQFGMDSATTGSLVGWGVMLALWPLAALLVWRWWPMPAPAARPALRELLGIPGVTTRPVPLRDAGQPRRSASGPPPAPPPRTPPPASSPPRSPLDRAWDAACGLCPTGGRRIVAAQEACAALLTRAAADPLDWSLADWARVIEARVPELVTAAAALLDDLDAIAAEARARLAPGEEARTDAVRHRFATLRAYVAGRTRRME